LFVDRSLTTLKAARDAGAAITKTLLMVGCGETADEVFDAMVLLRAADVSVLTIGQYLRPTPKHAPAQRLVDPEEFERFKEAGLSLGFRYRVGALGAFELSRSESISEGRARGPARSIFGPLRQEEAVGGS
jgi:lipoate synthase